MHIDQINHNNQKNKYATPHTRVDGGQCGPLCRMADSLKTITEDVLLSVR